MSSNRAFGVGCFHFGYRKPVPYRFSASDYVNDVKNGLSSLSSLSELDISFYEELCEPFDVSDEPLALLDDGDYFPGVMGLTISFTLFIPFRVQKELFPNESIELQTTTEKFRVSLRDSFHGPTSFIECIGATDECSPSGSVRLLRDYLEREFAKLTAPVSFEYLGPSPFHADFFLRPDEATTDQSFVMEETKRRGYNDLIFKYSANGSPDEALDDLFDELTSELGLFYEIQRRAVRLMHDGDNLTTQWQALQSKVTPNLGLFDLRSRMRIHRDAQALVSDAYTLQAQYAVDEQQVQRDIASTYEKGVQTYLEKYVCDRSEKLPVYPVESILKWGEHVVETSLKSAEIAAVVLSAIGGGIIGSLLTSLMARGG
jgi:hypothetical protein